MKIPRKSKGITRLLGMNGKKLLVSRDGFKMSRLLVDNTEKWQNSGNLSKDFGRG